MTLLQEQAVALVQGMPDEQLLHLVPMLKNLEALCSSLDEAQKTSVSMHAYNGLQKYRRQNAVVHDYKTELAALREEKYAHQVRGQIILSRETS